MEAHHSSQRDHAAGIAARSASFERRTRSEGQYRICIVVADHQLLACTIRIEIIEMRPNLFAMIRLPQPLDEDADFDVALDSWIEIASQPSSSSLSSVGEEGVIGGLQAHQNSRARRRRTLRPNAPASNLPKIDRSPSLEDASSQEEYDESESESDRVMSSSGEGPTFHASLAPASEGAAIQASDDDDEDRTAINYPINNAQCFTPQPNAFSHPPSGQLRTMSQPSPGSYFPAQRRESQSSVRTSLPPRRDTNRTSHMPQNILSPSYDAAAHHDEALRSSLSTLLSCAAAARGLQKPDSKRTATPAQQPRTNRVEPMSLRLVSESALPENSPPQFQEPTFKPTIRRESTSTSTSSENKKDHKRKAATTRSSSRERRALKKARRTTSNEDLHVSPTLLTWVVSAGVVVVLSALSFSAGYSVGKEAGKIEAGAIMSDEQIRSCAREAGRSSLGLKRSLARSAVQV